VADHLYPALEKNCFTVNLNVRLSKNTKVLLYLFKAVALSETTNASIFRPEETLGTAYGPASYSNAKGHKLILHHLKYLRLISILELTNVVRGLSLTRRQY
jgi:hypothetical protein